MGLAASPTSSSSDARLRRLKRHWERLGQRDPFWAALTDPEESGDGWDVDQFFRRGGDEVAAVLQRAEQLGVTVSRRRALDFGCGVGRVTQALAVQFEHCDVSTSRARCSGQRGTTTGTPNAARII